MHAKGEARVQRKASQRGTVEEGVVRNFLCLSLFFSTHEFSLNLADTMFVNELLQ